jgi:hypothetical protein
MLSSRSILPGGVGWIPYCTPSAERERRLQVDGECRLVQATKPGKRPR